MVRFLRPIIRVIFIAVVTPLLFSCGGEDELSDEVDFEITPERPIASPVDTSYVARDDSIITVTGPWFIAVMNIENKHPSYTLFVDSVVFESETSSGNVVLDSEKTISYNSTGCDPTTDNRVRFAVIPPGGTFSGDLNCDGVVDAIGDTEIWYIDSLPTGTTLNYTVKATLYGTFRDPTNATDPIRGRVEKIVFFTTQ
jgi:hypothetical protein